VTQPAPVTVGPASTVVAGGDETAARGLVLAFGRALLQAGVPAHRIEAALVRMTEVLGFEGSFFSAPTMLMFDFGPRGGRRENVLVRVEPGGIDLGRVSALQELVGALERRELDVPGARRRLAEILAWTPPYGSMLTLIAFGLASAGAGRLLGGGLPDVAASGALGLVVGVLVATSSGVGPLRRLLPAIAAMVVSFLGQSLALAGIPLTPITVALAAVIILLPGYALTVAIVEVATANLVSGAARLVGAGGTFLQLGLGLALGQSLAGRLPARIAAQAAAAPALPGWTLWLAPALAGLAFAVLMRARPRDILPIVAVAFVAVGATRGVAGWTAGPAEPAFVGALAVGIAGHGYARVMDRSATVLLTPGTFLLVPGSVGFLSVSSLLANDVTGGVGLAYKTVTVATALTAGLLVSAFAVPPRGDL